MTTIFFILIVDNKTKMGARQDSEGKLERIVLQTPARTDIPIDQIDPDPTQMRRSFDNKLLMIFADNIEIVGLMNPVTLNLINGYQRYVIIAGERRWRAHQILAKRSNNPSLKIPAHVYRDLTKEEFKILQSAENSYIPPPPEEAAEAYAQQYEMMREKYEAAGKVLSKTLFGKIVGRDQSTISAALLYVDLPQGIKQKVKEKRILYGTAVQIAKIKDPKIREYLAFKCTTRKYDEDEMRKIVNSQLEEQAGQTAFFAVSSRNERKRLNELIDKDTLQRALDAWHYFKNILRAAKEYPEQGIFRRNSVRSRLKGFRDIFQEAADYAYKKDPLKDEYEGPIPTITYQKKQKKKIS